MNDQSTQGSSTVAGNPVSAVPPLLLSQAREASGMHIAALAAALKVPVKKLEALEAGRYDELPDLVFARALASSACRQLKVDPAPILAQIPASLVPQLGDMETAINTPFRAASVGGVGPHSEAWFSRPAVLVAVVFLLAALVLVFLPDMSTPTATAPAPASEPQTAVSTPEPASQPASEAAATSAAPTAPASADATVSTAAPAAAQAVPAVPADTSAATVPAVAAAVVDSRKILTIRATGESWIQVVDGAGTVLIERLFKTGDAVDFSATPPYKVVLGRVDSAEVWVRGQAFDATPFARSGVARFEVK
jgi:cytoskeleton protein RodZ